MKNLKYCYLFLFFIVLFSAPCFADEEEDDIEEAEDDSNQPEDDNGVKILTDSNFDDFVEGKEVVLLEFYAPWCGHCKQFAPTYEEIAKTLREKDIDVCKIDATVEKTVAGKYDVTGYPTIVILKKGEPVKYDGGRSKDEVVKRVMELADPDWKPPPEAVITLTESNFKEIVDNEKIILVEFYAPWCGHCKKLAPEYEAAAQTLKNMDPPIPLGKVDATQESELAQKFDVTGYPTIKLFRKGVPFEYKGGRDKQGIVSYMIEQSSPPSEVLSNVKSTKNMLAKADDVVVIGFFENEESDAYKTYQEASNNVRGEYNFRHTFDTALIDHFKAKSGQIQVIIPERFHSDFEDQFYTLDVTADSKAADLEAFFLSKSVPLVGERTTTNAVNRYKARPIVVVYYSVDFSYEYRKATQIWRRKILEVANEYKGEFTFAISNEESFAEDLKRAELDDSPEEINVVIYDKDEKRYPMEPSDEFSADVLREFIDEYKNGNISPKYKSQPVPKKNNAGVKVVVGKTFDKIVMDDKRDVLIEFYAPWCGHCKALAPVYKKLGKKFKEDDSVVIAKMDATANDIPNPAYKAEGFPTIYWAKAGDKENPVKYEGGRDLDAFVNYINENSSKKGTKDEL